MPTPSWNCSVFDKVLGNIQFGIFFNIRFAYSIDKDSCTGRIAELKNTLNDIVGMVRDRNGVLVRSDIDGVLM